MIHRVFKVGVAGAHSTGKTSFLHELDNALAAKGLAVTRVRSLASEAKELGFPILRQHTFNSATWIATRGIALELEAERAADVVLVDRPVPDAVGYLTAALRSRAASLSQNEADYLSTLVKIHVPTYKVLLMTEIDPSIPVDTTKERDLDPVFRQMAEAGIKEAFSQAGADPQILRSDNRDEVICSVLRRIEDHVRSLARR